MGGGYIGSEKCPPVHEGIWGSKQGKGVESVTSMSRTSGGGGGVANRRKWVQRRKSKKFYYTDPKERGQLTKKLEENGKRSVKGLSPQRKEGGVRKPKNSKMSKKENRGEKK